MTAISISIHTDVDLTVGDLWPDGDAPANPTAADVMRLLTDDGAWTDGDRTRVKFRLLQDWSILDDLDVDVTVHPDTGPMTHAHART